MLLKPNAGMEIHRVKVPGFPFVRGVCDGPYVIMGPGCRELKIMAAGSEMWAEIGLPGVPFEHVSVSCKDRCPTWEEMNWVKDQFWGPEELVIQYHPPKSEYVNNNPFTLHLWKPVGFEIPLPPKVCV